MLFRIHEWRMHTENEPAAFTPHTNIQFNKDNKQVNFIFDGTKYRALFTKYCIPNSQYDHVYYL